MKKFVLILITAAILIGGWFGNKEIRRAQLLSSGEQLLLIKEDKSAYVYSTNIIEDNIDRTWDVINKVASLTPEKIAQLTEGIPLYEEATVATIVKDFDVQIPTQEQAVQWQTVLTTLQPSQKDACDNQDSLHYAQYCYVTHYIYELAKANATQERCDAIFIDDYKSDCQKALANAGEVNYPDTNGDTVIDFFEQYRSPEDSESFSEEPVVIN